jgi:site-specific DNA-methyltransferase (adenine-specific)
MNLIYGDCLVEMNNIPDGSVDMILCDLPYGTTACKWDVVIPFEPLWKHYWRVLKPNGAIVLFGSEPFSSNLRMSQIKYYKYDIIWNKNRFVNQCVARKQILKIHEVISIFYKKQCTYNPQGVIRVNKIIRQGTRTSDIIRNQIRKKEYIQEFTNYPKSIMEFKSQFGFHPTQKPVALLEYLIKTYTNEGETVLDNCMGSGSTGIACINTNRNFIGIEKDEKYFNIAKDRITRSLNEPIQ